MYNNRPIGLRYEVSGVKIFEDSSLSIDFFSFNNVYEEDKIFLHQIGDSNLYYSPIVTFVGVNSSGKTTALNLISTVADLHLSLKPLSSTWLGNNIDTDLLLDDKIVLTSYIYFSDSLIKTESVLKRERGPLGNVSYQIVEENFWRKKIASATKKNLFEFEDEMIMRSRSQLNEIDVVFSNDLSIAAYYRRGMTNDESKLDIFRSVFSLAGVFEHNRELIFDDIDVDFVKYLDSSIEEISLVKTKVDNQEKKVYKFKVFGDSEIREYDKQKLSSILSSGTRRGLMIINVVKVILQTGGVLFVDEIESNLNKSIINDIIKLFYSKKTNPFGATLVFSTHYSEILDFVRRKDSIIIFEKGQNFNKNRCINFSNVLSRNDLKKSEAFISNNLSVSSAPQKGYFKDFRNSLIDSINQFPVVGDK